MNIDQGMAKVEVLGKVWGNKAASALGSRFQYSKFPDRYSIFKRNPRRVGRGSNFSGGKRLVWCFHSFGCLSECLRLFSKDIGGFFKKDNGSFGFHWITKQS
jgi:hypothetical protein